MPEPSRRTYSTRSSGRTDKATPCSDKTFRGDFRRVDLRFQYATAWAALGPVLAQLSLKARTRRLLCVLASCNKL